MHIIEKDTKQPKLTRKTPSAPKQSFPPLHPFNPVGSVQYIRFEVNGMIWIMEITTLDENSFKFEGKWSSRPICVHEDTQQFLLIEVNDLPTLIDG